MTAGVGADFFPTQSLSQPKVQTITSKEVGLGAPFGPKPKKWLEIPDFLSECLDEPSEAELASALNIRSPFFIDGYPRPYLSDVVRAFRCLGNVGVYLEIGVFDRGNLAYISSLLPDGATLIGVDIQDDPVRDGLLRSVLKPNQTYIPIIGDSRLPGTVQLVRDALAGRQVDAVFIDGDHTAYGAMCDYVNYGEDMVRPGGLVLFHDCMWEGSDEYKGCAHAVSEISRFEDVYVVPGYGACHKYMLPLFKDEVWGAVAVLRVSDFEGRDSAAEDFVAPVPSQSVFFENQDWKAKLAFDLTQSFLMEHLTRQLGTVSFVQVGANDGSNADPINEFIVAGRWKGILIEPLPSAFARLKRNYEGIDGLEFINTAIGMQPGDTDFYSVRDPHSALSSFSYENVAKHQHWLPEVLSLVETITVPVTRLDALLELRGVATFDVLVVDAEGFDDMVIETIDIAKYRPKMLMFEHVHLTNHGSTKLRDRLTANGYHLIHDGYDCVAVLHGAIEDYIVDMAEKIIHAVK